LPRRLAKADPAIVARVERKRETRERRRLWAGPSRISLALNPSYACWFAQVVPIQPS
jgi:hypothetical protein